MALLHLNFLYHEVFINRKSSRTNHKNPTQHGAALSETLHSPYLSAAFFFRSMLYCTYITVASASQLQRRHVRHRQHITAYPRACLLRGHVVVVRNYRNDRTCATLSSQTTCVTQAAPNCMLASKVHEKTGIMVVDYGDETIKICISSSKATFATQAARNCVPA